MADIAITRTDTATKARIVGRVDGIKEEAEVTLSKLSESVVIADHTSVPDAMRGMGVGAALVDRLIADARAAHRADMSVRPCTGSASQSRMVRCHSVVERPDQRKQHLHRRVPHPARLILTRVRAFIWTHVSIKETNEPK